MTRNLARARKTVARVNNRITAMEITITTTSVRITREVLISLQTPTLALKVSARTMAPGSPFLVIALIVTRRLLRVRVQNIVLMVSQPTIHGKTASSCRNIPSEFFRIIIMVAAMVDILEILDPATPGPASRELAHRDILQAPGSKGTDVKILGFRGLVMVEATISAITKEIRTREVSLDFRAILSS
jgi:hypothetical protein